jgi:hypothetical protein
MVIIFYEMGSHKKTALHIPQAATLHIAICMHTQVYDTYSYHRRMSCGRCIVQTAPLRPAPLHLPPLPARRPQPQRGHARTPCTAESYRPRHAHPRLHHPLTSADPQWTRGSVYLGRGVRIKVGTCLYYKTFEYKWYQLIP